MADDHGKVARDRVFGLIRASGAQMVDVKFCGTLGRWRHFTLPSDQFTEKAFQEGIPLEGGNVLGPAARRDLLLFPDPETTFLDPFNQVPSVSIAADLYDAKTREPSPLDPRGVARRALAYLSESGRADTILMGIDLEFYIFDYVRFRNLPGASGYIVESAEAEWNTYRPPGDGYQPAHANPPGAGNHAIPPNDSLQAIRNEIVVRLKEAGVGVRYHHHDVGGPGQCEIGIQPGNLLQAADGVLKAKYFTSMVSVTQNRIASFMPKPLMGEAGTGMHVHQHLVRSGESLFFNESDPARLGPAALHYMGGLLQHAPALSALTNPSTNSYKRLATAPHAPVSGFPETFAVPETSNPRAARCLESMLPDATCNPYLALAAMAMAGLDGLKREVDPSGSLRPLPRDLDGALNALEHDHAFLLEGGVFTEALLSNWIRAKREEARELSLRPHPYEFQLYLDL
jgi:glutamine synthetase